MAYPELGWRRFSYETEAGSVDLGFDSSECPQLGFCMAQVDLDKTQRFTLTHWAGLSQLPEPTTTSATFMAKVVSTGGNHELQLTLPLVAEPTQSIETILTHRRNDVLVGGVGIHIGPESATLENGIRLTDDGFQGFGLTYYEETNRLQLAFVLAARRHFLTFPVPRHDYLWRKAEAILRRQPNPGGVRLVAHKLGFSYVSYSQNPNDFTLF